MESTKGEDRRYVDFYCVIDVDRPSRQLYYSGSKQVFSLSPFGSIHTEYSETEYSGHALRVASDSFNGFRSTSMKFMSSDGNLHFGWCCGSMSYTIPVVILKEPDRCQIEVKISNMDLEKARESKIPILGAKGAHGPLHKMFESGKYTDFTLVVSGKEFKAHKAVLANSSKYFEAMFSSGLIESQTGRLEVEDSEPEVIQALLEYIYSGELRKPIIDASEGDDEQSRNSKLREFYTSLMFAADKYQLDKSFGLERECEWALCGLITDHSVTSLLALAREHKLDYLSLGICRFLNRPEQNPNVFINLTHRYCRYSQ